MAYIYQADVYCDDCGRAVCTLLQVAGKAPATPDDERTFDSDQYPKRAGDDEEADTPRHCAVGEQCLNAVTLSSGEKVGYLFGELTDAGVEYVKEAVARALAGDGDAEVPELWQKHYTAKGYNVIPDIG